MGTTSQVFRYNRTYGSAPSNLTNAAWAALLPEQGGFFKHPSIAPERSAFSVFHQLHCLVNLIFFYSVLRDKSADGCS